MTQRVASAELDKILYKTYPVLDHGFVRVIDYMGCDSSIVEAARVSYGKGTKIHRQDIRLIRYLLRHGHTTPFEMCEIKLHIKLPIFVARQWIRHRTANINEHSGRYSIINQEYYIPNLDQIAKQSLDNKQGRGEAINLEQAKQVQQLLEDDAKQLYNNYNKLLKEDNIARELARINLSMNYYTQWYWKIDLHNLLHFIKLRIDNHAQYEIRCYAEVISDIVKSWVPYSYEAFCDYSLKSFTLSKQMLDVIRNSITKEQLKYDNPDSLSIKEKKELEKILFDS